MARILPIALAGLLGLAGCAADEKGPSMADAAAANEPAPTSVDTTSTSTLITTTASPSTTSASPEPVFTSTVHAVTAEELGASWRPDCPVAFSDLRRMELTHWNDDGQVAVGELVIHADHVDAMVVAFGAIFAARFPVHSMRPVSEFDGDDDASMAANNSSAFNCREIEGRPGVWSQHAYGGAVDINPLVNPWVRGEQVDPPAGAPYVERDPSVPGLIIGGDAVTTAFADIGWGWGGEWTSSLDLHHFSHNGR